MFVSMCQLCDLYENDSIFDKFECCLSGDGLRVATGSYRYLWWKPISAAQLLKMFCLHLTFSFHLCISNLFRVFGCTPGSTEATTLEASKNPMRWFYVKVLIPSMTHLGTRVPMVNLLTNLFISAGDKLLPLQGLHDHLGVVYHGL